MTKKLRYKVGYEHYVTETIDKSLLKNIVKMQKHLQRKENQKHGKKAQKVTKVYASKMLGKAIDNLLGGVL